MSQITKSMWKYSNLWFLHLLKEYSNLTFIIPCPITETAQHTNPNNKGEYTYNKNAQK